MSSENEFVLKLVDAGLSTDEVRLIQKYFWSDGRLDTRSATFQALLLGDYGKKLASIAAEKEAEKKGQ